MNTFLRPMVALMLALSMGFGAVALSGCGSSSSASSTAAASASSAASDEGAASDSASSSDSEQDDCYGDDLPVTKKSS